MLPPTRYPKKTNTKSANHARRDALLGVHHNWITVTNFKSSRTPSLKRDHNEANDCNYFGASYGHVCRF